MKILYINVSHNLQPRKKVSIWSFGGLQGEFGNKIYSQTIPAGPLAKWALFRLRILGKMSLRTRLRNCEIGSLLAPEQLMHAYK
jgi:hypothetical protein